MFENSSYVYLFDIALILISTKLLGLLTRKIKMPQVVGALVAGLILGPAIFGIIKEDSFIKQLSELGVIVLMFTAGLQTDVRELKKTGSASLIIAIIGVILPLIGGFGVAAIFNKGSFGDTHVLLENIFIGVILTATSVSITVETLKEMGKLNTKVGNAILGAALIDDILGIIVLTIISSVADPTINIYVAILKIVGFFVVAIGVGFGFLFFFNKWVKKYNKDLRRYIIIALSFSLFLAFAAEEFFQVADITGAFIAGLMISNTERTKYIISRIETLSYSFLSPIFFASVGLSVELSGMNMNIILFAILLLFIAIITKIVGCGIGAKMFGFTNLESLQVGTGMISRGEVALIVAAKGLTLGLISGIYFGPVIIIVVVTTIITPILLKMLYNTKAMSSKTIKTDLVTNYEQIGKIDLVEQKIYDCMDNTKATPDELFNCVVPIIPLPELPIIENPEINN